MTRDHDGTGTFIGGLVVGLALGAAIGVLFAPASGAVTRRRLRRKAEDLREQAEDSLDEVGTRARRAAARFRD